MDKEKKLKLQISIAAIAMGLLIIGLLYTIINYPTLWLALVGIGLVTLADIYWIVASVLSLMAIREQKRAEQYDSIFKSEKASYLMLKKYSEEITERLQRLEKMVNSPAAEIIKTQKSIAKVIISRERENAEALMNANDLLTEQLENLEKRMENNNLTAEAKYEKISATNKDQIIAKQQEFIVALKDMELRLNQVMGQRMVAAPMMAAPVAAPAPTVSAVPPVEEAPETPMTEELIAEAPIMEDPIIEAPVEEIAPVENEEPIAVEEPIAEEVAVPAEEPITAEEESVPAEEPVTEEPAAPVAEPSDDPNKKLSPDEIAAMFAAADAAPAEETPVEEAVAEEPAAEEPAPAEPADDPNKMMSPDDIAALISSMGAEPQPNVEPVPDPVSAESEAAEAQAEIPAAELVTPEAPPMPDLSDPNKKMSPDEIAALFANMG
ncbi:MAG: hypothetical protein E7282_00815 [Lachnospiraceae bacterium]|nr:hypothetical protein [Lachnospiraceae bacterium]